MTGGRVPVFNSIVALLRKPRYGKLCFVMIGVGDCLRDGRTGAGHRFAFRLEFAADDADIIRRFDADGNPVTSNSADNNRDIATNDQPFANFARKNQHV